MEEENQDQIQIPLQNQNSGNLISTIYKGYFVSSSVKANLDINQQFNNNQDENQKIEIESQQLQECLVINKPNSIEVFTIFQGIIEPCFETNIFANIKFISKIPSPNNSQPDFLFLLTEDLQYNIFQISKHGTKSFYNGNLNFPNLEQKSDDLFQIFVQNQVNKQESQGYILIYAYTEQIITISYKINEQNEIKCFKKPSNIRIHEPEIYQIVPIDQSLNQIAIIYNENLTDYSCIQVYDIDPNNDSEAKTSKKMHWFIQSQESITGLIILDNNTGGIVFTYSGISLYEYGQEKAIKNIIFNSIYKTHIKLENSQKSQNDQQMYIIGAENIQNGNGELFLVSINIMQKEFQIKYLGDCSCPDTLTYLGNKFVFLGSETDDCQLIQILPEVQQNSQYIKIWATFANLGLIYSMKNLKNDTSQQFLLSTSKRVQSLNIFQKSISLNKLREFKFNKPIKRIFTITNSIILVSFKNSSLLLNLQDSYFQTADKNKYISDLQTIHAFMIKDTTNFVQITQKGVNLIDTQSGVVSQLQLENDLQIFKAINHQNLIYVITNNNQIFIYQIQNSIIELQTQYQLEKQPSSLAITQNVLAISYWFNNSISFFRLSDFEHFKLQLNDTQEHINSIIFHKNKLLVGYGNGNVQIYYLSLNFDKQQFQVKIEQFKQINVGNKPVNLKAFNYQQSYFFEGQTNNFNINCISSEASILKCLEDKNERFEKISINSKRIQLMEEIIINNIPHLLTVSNNNSLQIGTLETSQKFHISSYGKDVQGKLNNQMFQGQKKENYKSEIVVICPRQKLVVSANIFEDPVFEINKSRISLYEQTTQELVDAVEIAGQKIFDIINTKNLILAGGEILNEEEQQQNLQNQQQIEQEEEIDQKGCLHILKISNEGKIQKYVKLFYKQQVISIHNLDENHIIVVTGQTLIIYKIIDLNQIIGNVDETQFIEEQFRYDSGILIYQIDINEQGYIMISDPIKNINVFKISLEEKILQPICRAVCLTKTIQAGFYGNAIMQGDLSGNIIILEKDISAKSDLERLQLKITDAICIGDQVTSSCKSKVNTSDYHDQIMKNCQLDQTFFGTRKGTLGTIINLEDSVFELLKQLQTLLIEQLQPELGFQYDQWKKVKLPQFIEQQSDFINFEIIRKIQDFNNNKVQEIIDKINIKNKPTVQDLILLIDNLDQLTF